jgi:hypothetical protein
MSEGERDVMGTGKHPSDAANVGKKRTTPLPNEAQPEAKIARGGFDFAKADRKMSSSPTRVRYRPLEALCYRFALNENSLFAFK